MFSRRASLLGLGGGLLGLAGCGFRPLYAPVTTEDGGAEDIRNELAAVRIGNIPERSGQLLRRDLQRRFPAIGEVRGPGLMVATEFTGTDGKPDKETCKRVQEACLSAGLMLLTCGPFENVVRWIPPLVVTKEQIAEALGVFAGALEKTLVPEGAV